MSRIKRLRTHWYRLTDGLRYAFGWTFLHNTTCPHCERDIEIEVG